MLSGSHTSCGDFWVCVQGFMNNYGPSYIEINYTEVINGHMDELRSYHPWNGELLSIPETESLFDAVALPNYIRQNYASKSLHDYIQSCVQANNDLIHRGFVPSIVVHVISEDRTYYVPDIDYTHDWEALNDLMVNDSVANGYVSSFHK